MGRLASHTLVLYCLQAELSLFCPSLPLWVLASTSLPGDTPHVGTEHPPPPKACTGSGACRDATVGITTTLQGQREPHAPQQQRWWKPHSDLAAEMPLHRGGAMGLPAYEPMGCVSWGTCLSRELCAMHCSSRPQCWLPAGTKGV